MKIQSLAIIFIIIIMPITLVVSEYVDNKVKVATTELNYNTKLLDSTYDAIKAYQLNTVNNAFGDETTKKIKDLEAAAKTFYNSLTSNFNYTGYKSDVMSEYVPAIVFTMYDGYYIYSPFTNVLTEVAEGDYDQEFSNNGDIEEGLKPYIYYSCRYKVGTNSDFVITYTLDNYITIQGKINGQYIYDYGYLYSIASTSDLARNSGGIYYDDHEESYTYGGIKFEKTDTEELKEYVGTTEYSYVKINGRKYYLDENYDTTRTGTIDIGTNGITINEGSGIFFIDSDGTKNYTLSTYTTDATDKEKETFLKYCRAIKCNKSAYEYYKNAYQFSKAVLGSAVSGYKDKAGSAVSGYYLSNLKASNAEIWNNPASDTSSIQAYGDINIFETTDSNTKLENESSNFNQHRKTIIRYVIETNLSTAIAGFSSSAATSFIMPKIEEDDWEIIQNDVCAISFLQGINIGSKIYNNYVVVANTLTKEYIDEDDIYILTYDSTNDIRLYCKPNDASIESDNVLLKSTLGYYPGIWKLNVEQKQDASTGTTHYYIPLSYSKNGNLIGVLGSYTSIMGSYKINSIETSDMYKYIASSTNDNLKKAYYVGLGRERWGSFNINNINYELNTNDVNEYFLNAYTP